MERMQLEATKAGAEGVVGADLHEGSHDWSTHVIEFFAIGTAVVPIEGGSACGRDSRSAAGAFGEQLIQPLPCKGRGLGWGLWASKPALETSPTPIPSPEGEG